MNRFFFHHLVAFTLSTIALFAIATPAHATPRPHNSHGTAHFTSANTFAGTGLATHLGRYDETGTITLTPTSDPAVFDAAATSTYTAANGDQLTATYTGQLNAATGVITATGTYTGGTGRFANATGSSTLSAQLLPDGSLDVSVKGTLDY
jgi:hypothetical protein